MSLYQDTTSHLCKVLYLYTIVCLFKATFFQLRHQRLSTRSRMYKSASWSTPCGVRLSLWLILIKPNKPCWFDRHCYRPVFLRDYIMAIVFSSRNQQQSQLRSYSLSVLIFLCTTWMMLRLQFSRSNIKHPSSIF